jgi:hypothetical protein
MQERIKTDIKFSPFFAEKRLVAENTSEFSDVYLQLCAYLRELFVFFFEQLPSFRFLMRQP